MRLAAAWIAAALWAGQAGADATLGDATRGADLFEDCAGCHMVGEGAETMVGPHLNGLFGRRAAAIEDFAYSEGLARAGAEGLAWSAETLHVYIEKPQNLVSRTRMNYDGMPDAQDRADLLAYLRLFSANPRDIPEAPPTAAPAPPLAPDALLALEGDPAYGEYLAGECVTCHQESGANDGIPSITGWREDVFKAALHGYRIKARPNEAMQLIAGTLSNEEIAALAAWFGRKQ